MHGREERTCVGASRQEKGLPSIPSARRGKGLAFVLEGNVHADSVEVQVIRSQDLTVGLYEHNGVSIPDHVREGSTERIPRSPVSCPQAIA